MTIVAPGEAPTSEVEVAKIENADSIPVLDKQGELSSIPSSTAYAEFINNPDYTMVYDLEEGDEVYLDNLPYRVNESGPVSITLIPRQVLGADKIANPDPSRVKFLQEVTALPSVREYLRALAIFTRAYTDIGRGKFRGNDFRASIDYFDDNDDFIVAIQLLKAAMLRPDGDALEDLIFVGQTRTRV